MGVRRMRSRAGWSRNSHLWPFASGSEVRRSACRQVDGEASREEVDETRGEEVGHHGAAFLADLIFCLSPILAATPTFSSPRCVPRGRVTGCLRYFTRCVITFCIVQ